MPTTNAMSGTKFYFIGAVILISWSAAKMIGARIVAKINTSVIIFPPFN